MRHASIALLVLLAHAALPAPLRAEESGLLRELLVLEPVARGGRSPFPTDPVEAARVLGAWRAPAEGDVVALPDGTTRTWRRLVADEGGTFPADPAFRGGHAFATVPSERERVVVLEASGHARALVNGEPRMGDVYGTIESRLPVLLRAGANEILFRCGRGPIRARLVDPPAPVYATAHDATLPDVLRGRGGAYRLGVVVVNATTEARRDVAVVTSVAGGRATTSTIAHLPPLSAFRAPLEVDVPASVEGKAVEVVVSVAPGPPVRLPLAVRAPDEKHRRTFVSGIDGSVQYFAVTPAHPPPGDEGPRALVLTLHGASVEAEGQANAYGPKTWAHVVAPTNRRPFGFDWEDWGRLDALEVLARAEEELGTDPRRTYLTGHSMGGHGTWMIGAQSPGRFAAIAPSAGWRDFGSYAGAAAPATDDPVLRLLARAANPHRLELWEENLAAAGVYVLHGDADDNVPVTEAREMRRRLGAFHPNFAYFEKAGAGHWWGAECVDWPPLFDFLRQNVLPAAGEESFVTVSPAILGRGARLGVAVLEQVRSLEPSRVRAKPLADGGLEVVTENVRRLGVPARTGAGALAIDGQEMEPAVEYARASNGRWRARAAGGRPRKDARLFGPFKDAFRNRVVFVHGTRGTPEENAWSLAKARFDAEQLAYRGNGAVRVVPDSDPGLASPEGNVVLYGHRDMNAAWRLVPGSCPIDVRRGVVVVGERRVEGDDLVALFCHPSVSGNGLAVVAGTGPAGRRLADALPYFTSGVAYPDWCVLRADLLSAGGEGVRAAGFFEGDWSLGDDVAWR